jgi:hypothetical protein
MSAVTHTIRTSIVIDAEIVPDIAAIQRAPDANIAWKTSVQTAISAQSTVVASALGVIIVVTYTIQTRIVTNAGIVPDIAPIQPAPDASVAWKSSVHTVITA